MTTKKSSLKRRLLHVACGLLVLSSVTPGICLKNPLLKYGRLKRSRQITQMFENSRVDPRYNYYVTGSGNIPYAIIGIDKQYRLRKGLWKPVNPSPQLLRSWVSSMDLIYGHPPYGAQILDHRGNPVGIWYSSKQWTTVIVDEDGHIAVFAPEPPGFSGGR